MSKGTITDDSRIRAAVPTLLHLANRGANVIVMSHLGRPKGVEPELSLRPVSSQLAHALEREVQFAADCVGEPAQTAVDNLHDGQVLLLENVRFHPEDEADDPDFARRLAALGQLYVNDAFAASHRAHASVVGVAAYLPAYAGELMEAELKALHQALDNPKRPMIAVVGGAKVSTKVGVLRNLLKKVDALIIGGAMANTFFKAQGYPTGSGLVEDSALEEAKEVADQAGGKLLLPVDLVCARRMEAGQPLRIMDADKVEPGWMALDIGPKSVALLRPTTARRRRRRLEWAHGGIRDPRFQRWDKGDRRGDRNLRRLHAGRWGRYGRGHRIPWAERTFLARFDRGRRNPRVPGGQSTARHRDPQGGLMASRVSPMPLVAANWKMNPNDAGDALDLVRGVLSVARGHADRVEVAIFPPFPWLMSVSEVIAESGVELGAQDCFWELSGAFTGEVSPAMLKGWCQWVITGHSERRIYLAETDEMVSKKTAAALGMRAERDHVRGRAGRPL